MKANFTCCDLNGARTLLAADRDIDDMLNGRESDVRRRIPVGLLVNVDLATARR